VGHGVKVADPMKDVAVGRGIKTQAAPVEVCNFIHMYDVTGSVLIKECTFLWDADLWNVLCC